MAGQRTAGDGRLHQRPQAERLKELLAPYGIPCSISEASFIEATAAAIGTGVTLLLGEISRGFRLPDARLVMIAEEELFGRRVRRRGVSEVRKKQILASLAELKPGDFMVHIDHGIGRYHGLQHISVGEWGATSCCWSMPGGQALPAGGPARAGTALCRAGGEPARPGQAGGSGWEKSRARPAGISRNGRRTAEIYARRQISEGFSFSPPGRECTANSRPPSPGRRPRPALRHPGRAGRHAAFRPWTGWCAAMWVTARRKSPCGARSRPPWTASRSAYWSHHHPGPAALRDLPRTAEGVPDHGGGTLALPHPQGAEGHPGAAQEGDIDIVIGTHRMLQKDVAFKDLDC